MPSVALLQPDASQDACVGTRRESEVRSREPHTRAHQQRRGAASTQDQLGLLTGFRMPREPLRHESVERADQLSFTRRGIGAVVLSHLCRPIGPHRLMHVIKPRSMPVQDQDARGTIASMRLGDCDQLLRLACTWIGFRIACRLLLHGSLCAAMVP